MKLPLSFLALGAMFALPAEVLAESSTDISVGFEHRPGEKSRSKSGSFGGIELPPYLQCVPYARELSGIQIYGDAHSWWDQAAGRYQRGKQPQVGAVMAFEPHGNMTLGHVAAVSKVIDSRTVLISHSNWSPINGRRGQIERDVRAVDVSPNNDWSMVRVWYHPLQAVGKTAWPVHGFIYAGQARGGSKASPKPPLANTLIARLAQPQLAQPLAAISKPPNSKLSKKFSQAFANLATASAAPSAMVQPAKAPAAKVQAAVQPKLAAQPTFRPAPRQSDPVLAAIARYEK